MRKAFIDELTIAEVFSASAPVTLTGRLDAVDFSSAAVVSSGSWTLGLTVTSSNGRRLSVTEVYPFTSSYYGETGCNQTAHALMPAVQNLVGKTVRHHEFRALIDPNAPAR